MTEPSPSEEAIFLAALEKTTGPERIAYVAAACAGNEPLRHRVLELLAGHDASRGPLDAPPAPLGATIDGFVERPGTQIGPYKLLQQIGEGGMGVVYMAEQLEPVKRRVALKIIKPGMDTRQVIARFEAERQALSLMDHPNIARVLDAGTTESGRPYFVMELVKGQPITQYCDEHHLTPRQRLELLLPVCQAIQHAHQKGIIHRDIKPTNILVAEYDQKAVPKVIDFGVAKATSQALTEKTMFTGFGQIVGTLEYMSPEQAKVNQLDIDTRSDIYSLGVLLYELLTGSTPFDKERLRSAGWDEMLRIIREEEPLKPSTKLSSNETLPSVAASRSMEPSRLSRSVRGELDWIVMKALEKDRNRRYETASVLASDLQHYLDDEPVLACPPSAGYRLRKFVRRNKGALAMGGAVLLCFVLLGGVVGWAWRDRAARAHEIAQEEALTEQLIRQSLDRTAASRAELHRQLKRPGGVQELLNQPARWELFLKTAAGELAQARTLALRIEKSHDARFTSAMVKLEEQLARDQAEYELALRLENIRLDVEERLATAEYPQAFADFRILNDDPAAVASRIASSPIREQLVAALDGWAFWAFQKHRDEALAARLLEVARGAAPESESGSRLRQLNVWRDPEHLANLIEEVPVDELSPMQCELIWALLPRRAGDIRRESWLRRAQAAYPNDYWMNSCLARELMDSEPVEAAGYFRVAIAVRPGSKNAYNDLGVLLKRQQKLPEAIACYEKAIECDPKFVVGYSNISGVFLKQGKVDEAIAWARKAVAINPRHAKAHDNLGNAFFVQGKLDDAIQCHRTAIEISPNLASAHYNLGLDLRTQGRPEDAVASFRKSIELRPNYADAHLGLGNALFDLGKTDEAITCYRSALQIDPQHTKAHENLGNILVWQGKLDEGINCYRKAIEIKPNLASAHYNLGRTLKKQGKAEDAVAAYRKLIEFQPNVAEAHYVLGNALCDLGKNDEAIACYQKALEIEPKFASAHHNLGIRFEERGELEKAIDCYRAALQIDPQHALAHDCLGNAFYLQGNLDDAIKCYRTAIEIMPNLASAHYNLGRILRKQGKAEEAVTSYRKSIELRPNFADAHVGLGNALCDLGKTDEGIACYRRAIEIDPKNALAHEILGRALQRAGIVEEAATENSGR
jgi:tetratricopeptide (TPR) repeat protein/tRNA A-37 threonylcarbamoyl transferase component Bud32